MSIYQVVLKAIGPGGDDLRNIHHYEFPSYVPDDAELEEFIENITTAHAGYISACADDVTFEAWDVRRVDLGDLPTAEMIPAAWPVTGGAGAGAMLPPQVAALVTWKAPTTFPRSTRSYCFPFTTAALSPTGTITLAIRTILETWALDMEEIAVTGQVDAQKVAVQYSGDPRVVTASNVVFQTPVDSVFATQRSRRFGVGS